MSLESRDTNKRQELRRALLVDNEVCMLHMLSRLLRRQGFVTDNAVSATQARELVKAHPVDRWSLFVLDLNLTDGSGLSLARWLRVSGLARTVPIVLCTGSLDSNVEQEASRAGCDAVLRKPFQLEAFNSMLESLEPQNVAAALVHASARVAGGGSLTAR